MDFPRGILDLEVLLLKITEKDVRSLVKEAINCYSVGAYRAAINTLWIALIYDTYRKADYLANTFNDDKAKSIVEAIEKGVSNKNYVKEWQILERYLREILEDVSEIRLKQLMHLRDLRNACSHPTFFSEQGKIFEPSAEEVRAAIRNAVETFLLHPPVRGRSALSALERDLYSEYTPEEFEDFYRFVEQRYLSRGSKYFIRNAVIKFFKDYFFEENDKRLNRLLILLKILYSKYPEYFREQNLVNFTESLPDNKMEKLGKLLLYLEHLIEIIPNTVKLKFKGYVRQLELWSRLLFEIKFWEKLNISLDDIKTDIKEIMRKSYNLGFSFDAFIRKNDLNIDKIREVIIEAVIEIIPDVGTFAEATDFLNRNRRFLALISSRDELKELLNAIIQNKGRYWNYYLGDRNNQFIQSPYRKENLQILFESLRKDVIECNSSIIQEFIDKIYNEILADSPYESQSDLEKEKSKILEFLSLSS